MWYQALRSMGMILSVNWNAAQKNSHMLIMNIFKPSLNPIGSMYGIFTYMFHKIQPNVGKYKNEGESNNAF